MLTSKYLCGNKCNRYRLLVFLQLSFIPIHYKVSVNYAVQFFRRLQIVLRALRLRDDIGPGAGRPRPRSGNIVSRPCGRSVRFSFTRVNDIVYIFDITTNASLVVKYAGASPIAILPFLCDSSTSEWRNG